MANEGESCRSLSEPPLTDEEIRSIRHIMPLIAAAKTFAVILPPLGRLIKWAGWMIILLIALKNGLPMSQLMNFWPH